MQQQNHKPRVTCGHPKKRQNEYYLYLWRKQMKDYQDLIGKVVIAIAIIISGVLIANALSTGFSNIHSALVNMGGLIRDGLLQGSTP